MKSLLCRSKQKRCKHAVMIFRYQTTLSLIRRRKFIYLCFGWETLLNLGQLKITLFWRNCKKWVSKSRFFDAKTIIDVTYHIFTPFTLGFIIDSNLIRSNFIRRVILLNSCINTRLDSNLCKLLSHRKDKFYIQFDFMNVFRVFFQRWRKIWIKLYLLLCY